MDLDDMKHAWQVLDRGLAQQSALNLQWLRDSKLDRTRCRLRPLKIGALIAIATGVLGTLFFAPFWVAHRTEWPQCVAGLIMHAYCIALIIFGAVMLTQMARVDYAAPVLGIQQQLRQLRRTYVIGGWMIGLPWWFLTAPLLVVLTDGTVMTNAPLAVWSQLIVGAVGLCAMGGFYRWSHRPAHAHIGRKLDDAMAGASMRRAQEAIDDIARFARD